MSETQNFLDMFPCCAGMTEAAGGLDKAEVRGVKIRREDRTIPHHD